MGLSGNIKPFEISLAPLEAQWRPEDREGWGRSVFCRTEHEEARKIGASKDVLKMQTAAIIPTVLTATSVLNLACNADSPRVW